MVKGCGKGYRQAATKEIHRAGREGPVHRGSSPVDLGWVALLAVDVLTNLEAFKPHSVGVFMEAASHECGKLLTPRPASLVALEDEGWG